MPRRRKAALTKHLWETKTFKLAAASLTLLAGLSFVPKKFQSDLLVAATGLTAIATITARHGAGEAAREAAGEEDRE